MMPGYDEEMGRDVEQKASQVGMHMLYRMGGHAGAAKNDLGLSSRQEAAHGRRRASDPTAAADRRAQDAIAGATGRRATVDAHIADGVPYKTLAALDPGAAADISRQLSYFGIEHYVRIGDMCGHERIVTDGSHQAVGAVTAEDIEARRAAGFYREEAPASLFEEVGAARESGFYEVYVPDRDLERAIAEGRLDPQAAIAELLEGRTPDGADPSDFVDRLITLGDGEYMAFSDLPAPQREFIEYHGADELRERLAAIDACLEAREEVFWNAYDAPSAAEIAALGLDPEEVIGGQFTARFETMPWDAHGEILTDALDKLGIPWHADMVRLAHGDARGMVEVTVSERHAGYMKQVVDDFSGRVRGFGRERVENYEELAALVDEGAAHRHAIDDMVYRTPPLPQEYKHWIAGAFDELGIEYALTENAEDGTFTIVTKESEWRQHGYKLNHAADAFNDVRPPEFKEQAQRAYERSDKAKQNRERANRRLQTARNRERSMRNQRNTRVTHDVERSVKSAEAQKSVAKETVKKLTLGK